MYAHYDQPRVIAWNWSFLPVDLAFSILGLALDPSQQRLDVEPIAGIPADTPLRLYSNPRAVVVEARPSFVWDATAMLALALLSTFAVIGLLCWVLFQLAVFALPFFAAVTVGLALIKSSGNLAAALAVGLIFGVTTYLVGRWAFRVTPSPLMRMVIAIVFVLPAAVAGYHAVHGLMALGVSSGPLRVALGAAGGVLVGGTAFTRLVTEHPAEAPSVGLHA
jgi:hypothetical protein